MERDEAAATGCRLLTPEELGVDRIRQEGQEGAGLWAELLRRAFEAIGLPRGSIALAGRASNGTVVGACGELAGDGWAFGDGRRLVLEQRKRKSASEVVAARRAATGVCAAFRRVAEMLVASRRRESGLELDHRPLSVGRLRAEIAQQLAKHGLDQPEGNIVAPGRDAGVPHSTGDDRRILQADETLVVDLFPKGRVFADCTRTFWVGEPPPAVVEAHNAVRATLLEAHRELRPEVRGWDLQISACDQLEAAGHATPRCEPGTQEGYVHGLGHGVGYEIHEYPSFRRRAGTEGVLAAGDLLTLEPGLYYPDHPDGGFGIRLEDFVYLGEGGPENLTPLPYELDPGAW